MAKKNLSPQSLPSLDAAENGENVSLIPPCAPKRKGRWTLAAVPLMLVAGCAWMACRTASNDSDAVHVTDTPTVHRHLQNVAVGGVCDTDADCADAAAYCFLNVCSISDGRTIFYDQLAPDGGTGFSSTSPLNGDIKDLIQTLLPGDTLTIMGELTNPSFDPSYSFQSVADEHLWHDENTLTVSNVHGEAGRPITIKGKFNGHLLRGDGANIIRVMNSSYVRFYKLQVQGQVDDIPYETAKALQLVYKTSEGEIKYRADPSLSDEQIGALVLPTLIDVSRPSYTNTRGFYASNSHHLVVEECFIHHVPGTGLRVAYSEYVDVIDNEVAHCSRKSYSGTHGLVPTYIKDDIVNDPAGVYRMRVLRNEVHHNYNEIWSWAPTKTKIHPGIDEGKGISIQRVKIWNNGGRALFAGNVIYLNGYSGLHSNDSHNLDFIGNTAYMNSYTASVWEVQQTGTKGTGSRVGISISMGTGHRLYNNVAVCDSDVQGACLGFFKDAEVEADSNMQWGVGSLPLNLDNSDSFSYVNVATNQYEDDPRFFNPGTFKFRLRSNSPALGLGDSTMAQIAPLDFTGSPRDLVAPDLGAIERA